MAKVLIIFKSDPADVIEKKIQDWSAVVAFPVKAFNATKYTGKIKSYGDGLAYQRNIRNEWD